jgi:hypothetical protein
VGEWQQEKSTELKMVRNPPPSPREVDFFALVKKTEGVNLLSATVNLHKNMLKNFKL